METTKYALVALIVLVGLAAPNAVWADDIVAANVSDTYNGNSVCGPSGTSLCSEVFNASFLWDNTTGTAVAGSFQFSAVGPLGTWGVLQPPVLNTFDNMLVFSAEGSLLDGVSFQFNLASNNLLTPGTYPLQLISSPGGFISNLVCEEALCLTDFGPGNPVPSSFLTATVSEVAVPEPSSLLLLGTGLAGMLGAVRRKLRK